MRSVRLVAVASLLLAACAWGTPSNAASSTITEVTGFGSNPGNLQMFKYVPPGLPTGRPLVVALHGCGTAASIYSGTGWLELADTYGFALALPQQKRQNNAGKCFNSWLAADSARTGGEGESVAQMVTWMKNNYGSDSSKVFVTGISAGAAMALVELATYPDVYAAGAVIATPPYKCATTSFETGPCNDGTVTKTPAQWGDLVRAAFSWSGPRPKVAVWHGTADTTVYPANMTEVMKQFTNVNGVDQTPDVTDTVAGYPHNVYKDASGNAQVETYSITGMGHAQPIDPGTGTANCGTTGQYMADVNICAGYYMSKWFGIIP